MNIIFATTIMDYGGVWTNVRDLADAFAARGDSVRIATPAYSVVRDDVAQRGLKWLNFDQITSEEADVVHFHLHDTYDLPSVRAVVGARLRGRATAVIVTEHLPRTPVSDSALQRDPTLPPGRRKPGARYIKTALKFAQFRAAHRVVTVSDSSATFLARRYGLSSTKVSTVHNGVAVDAPSRTAPLSSPLRVMAVGALGWRKGFDVLIDAAALAKRPWHVDVYGDGQLRSALASAAEPVSDRVRFCGWKSDVMDRAADYHVCCLPSRGEAFPYTLLETMARGLPAVATRVDGVPELVREGKDGMLVDPDSPLQLATALDKMADLTASQHASFSASASERVAGAFTLRQMVDGTAWVYEKALSEARSPGRAGRR